MRIPAYLISQSWLISYFSHNLRFEQNLGANLMHNEVLEQGNCKVAG